MDNLWICEDFSCSVYVYGASAKVCPGCGTEGRKMTQDQANAFTRTYREVQA
jgi:hypothetical protein